MSRAIRHEHPRRQGRPRRPTGAWAAGAAAAGFRALARRRGGPALHPHGLTCTADLEVVADGGGPWGVRWLDSPARYAATARLSRAGGLPVRLPDGLGLAVRVQAGDALDEPVDLLLTSCGRGRLTRHLPLPRTDALGGPYGSLLAYRIGDRFGLLAAVPRRTGRSARAAHGDPESLRAALRHAPLVFDLRAQTPRGVWRTFAVLTVRTALPLGRTQSLGFDPYEHSAPGFAPGPALAAVRHAAYRGSRTGRSRST
ncbi:phosphodiesterase [Streptomyces galbus]|uniref:Phosphodiesterase n=1 Tax=Streptomyces galbus TaxID=33898 RepID=A0ABX1IH69_STRGB|nr:phosphodiesterase [Streptomyces galbus]NKQ24794.1 phosphodiesterase [Streptomyces galbus]